MTQKLAALYICAIASVVAATWKPTQSSPRVKWRLTDEASCMIETASELSSHVSLRLIVGRRVGDIKDIRVEASNTDRPLEVWTNAGPYDSRSVVANDTHVLRIHIELLSEQKRAPLLKTESLDTTALICGKTRLTVRTSQ